jgi:hypothetical protein
MKKWKSRLHTVFGAENSIRDCGEGEHTCGAGEQNLYSVV